MALTKSQLKQFKEWMEDGNVSKNNDGTYSTQDAQYRNKLKDFNELKKYFKKEFIVDEYEHGGSMGSNNKNGKYLDSISSDKKSKILKNIASHYRISVSDAEGEVRDADAEMLYEYITNEALRMDVYNDMERGKMAKGGDIMGVDSNGLVEKAKNKVGKWIFSVTYADMIDGRKVFRNYPNYVSEYFNSKTEAEKALQEKLSKTNKMAKGGSFIGKQKNLDINKNGKIDSEDLQMIRENKMAMGGSLKGKIFYVEGTYPAIREIKNRVSTKRLEQLVMNGGIGSLLTFDSHKEADEYYAQNSIIGMGLATQVNILDRRTILKAREKRDSQLKTKMAKGGGVGSEIEELWQGYAEAVLFTEEEELGSNYTIYDFDEKTESSTKKMLATYYKNNKKAIEESELSLDVIGNDIWYTRSGQGAGFFDHSLDDEIEKQLIDGAKAMGEFPSVEIHNGKVLIRGGKVFAHGGEFNYDYYEVYDESTGKSLMIYAIDQEDAESIAEELDFESFEDGDEYNPNDEEYAKGGGVDDNIIDTKQAKNHDEVYNILDKWGNKKRIVNAPSWDLETPYSRGWVEEGEKITVILKKVIEVGKPTFYIWSWKKVYEHGGSMDSQHGIDLFEDYENIPANVQSILNKYEDAFMDGDYKELQKALTQLKKIGYTFEFDLDGQAYDLRPIGTKGKSEMDIYANGGGMEGKKSVKSYFESINLDKLPAQAKDYINTQILNDSDIDLIDLSDEDFTSIQQLIAESYPQAIDGDMSDNTTTSGDNEDSLEDAIESLQTLLEFADEKERKSIEEAIEALELLV